MADEDIDYSDIPPLTNEQLLAMKPLQELLPNMVSNKVAVTIWLEADIAKWLDRELQQDNKKSYQTLINMALYRYIKNQEKLVA